MEKLIKMNAVEFEGYAVTVTVEGGVEEYAKAFLHVFNNVREANELFKVDNYAWNNDITVYCDIESKEELTEYLENFGEIKRIDKVLMYQILEAPDRDYDEYYDQIIVPYFE